MGPPPEKKVVEQALICQRYQAEVNANVCCCHVDMEMNFGAPATISSVICARGFEARHIKRAETGRSLYVDKRIVFRYYFLN
jgi:hypothetical protein